MNEDKELTEEEKRQRGQIAYEKSVMQEEVAKLIDESRDKLIKRVKRRLRLEYKELSKKL